MRLLLVRHGITQYNINGFYTGQTDILLSKLGEEQAEALGKYLAHDRLDVIISSDLRRARDTARAVARHQHLTVLENPDLREASFGIWEGLPRTQIQAEDGKRWEAWRRDPINTAPPGGETVAEVSERAARALRLCYESYRNQTVLWVTHGGLMGVAICHALRLDLSYRHCFQLDNASVTEFSFDQRLPLLVRLNDTAYLHNLTAARQMEVKL